MIKIRRQNVLAQRFFVYSLIHPMIFAARFCEMKDLIKIHICGNFYQYNICGCIIKISQNFLFYFRIHERWQIGFKLPPRDTPKVG